MQRKISIVSLFFCLILSVALWGYVSLKTPATIFVQFPLVIQLQEDKAVQNELPKFITAKIRASGWQIINLEYISAKPECTIDLDKFTEVSAGSFSLSKNDILQNLRPALSLEKIVELSPENISITTGTIAQRTVPIAPVIEIAPREGFTVVGDIHVEPDSILLRGNETMLQTVQKWQTSAVKILDATKSIRIEVKLVDSLQNHIALSQQTVVLSAEIQQTAEITFNDIPLEVLSEPAQSNHKLLPDRISVTIRGGAEQIAQLSSSSVRALVEFQTILHDTTGIITPVISLPSSLTLLNINPPYLRHKIVDKPVTHRTSFIRK
ncbi:MAG: YbbR-like domain-containing protein [Ignavibacteriae bacterium]|nr:YbbR-like domain-containing protein [Ignavibacteriota bacterium]